MIEFLVTLTVAIVISFCWWKLNGDYSVRDYFKAFLLIVWTSLGPDVPKIFLNGNRALVNPSAWYITAVVGFLLIVSKCVLKQAKYLNYILFLEIGLVAHLTIDFFF